MTKKGKECYGLRKELPEPVFGQIKHVRGFDHFLLRGLDQVNSEWKVICTGHNLLKLIQSFWSRVIRPGNTRLSDGILSPL